MGCDVRKSVFGVSDQVRHNRAVKPQKMARGLKVWIYEVDCAIYVLKTRAQLICAFDFAYSKISVSHGAAHIIQGGLLL